MIMRYGMIRKEVVCMLYGANSNCTEKIRRIRTRKNVQFRIAKVIKRF